MPVRSYKDLHVWSQALDFGVEIYRLTSNFPREEIYGLRAQIRKSATSVALNLAEGHSRSGTKEFLSFLSIALGSLAETETLLMLSQRLGYLNDQETNSLMRRAEEIGRMLRGLQQTLHRRLRARSAR
ncbi:MAG: four helix bundle protein [Thermoanaerobaculia bacterium]